MTRVYVGNLDSRVTERELEDEFWVFGVLRSIWVARKPPGYAFIDFDDRRDALDTIRELDGVIVLVIVPQGSAVSHLFMVAAIASHHPITVGVKNHHMPIGIRVS
eukprot:TRINITY_DN1772_c0_g3_i2.p1 TRINITY_DN1772_c0_g3~~TRINITY_DN1772_c0_g3_i2.p1  ORF type:complete len:105 (-),score=4.16 TRINITY_DN1772_c0_g3_i2:2225-2539(-)